MNSNKVKNELIDRFHRLGGNLNSRKEEALSKDIKKYFKDTGKSDEQLIAILNILEIYKLKREFYIVEYPRTLIETYKIAIPMIQMFKYISVDNFDVNDLKISQLAVGYAETIEESEELCKKVLIALNKRMKGKPNHKKARFFYHMNMIRRAF